MFKSAVVLIFSFVSGGCLAQSLPSIPAGVCVPRQLLDLIGNYLPGQPWREVQITMESLVQVAKNPVACDLQRLPPPAQQELSK